jgi:transposase
LIDLPEHAPAALLADKAYDTDAIRDDLKKRGIKAVIPPKSNRTATIRYNQRLYRERNCIERVLGHLKINRAVATRYDQLADSFLGMLYLASARYWIKFVHAASADDRRVGALRLRRPSPTAGGCCRLGQTFCEKYCAIGNKSDWSRPCAIGDIKSLLRAPDLKSGNSMNR